MLKRIVLPATGQLVTFGRIISPHRVSSFKIGDALNLSMLPPAPMPFNWAKGNLALNEAGLENILYNDKYGDCTCAGAAHIIDQTLAKSGNPYAPITPEQVLYAYSRVTSPPFNPRTGANDNGADEVAVLNWWRDHGFLKDGSHKILGHATVDPSNLALITSCAWLFENLYLGMALPDAWIKPGPSGSGFVWDVEGDPNPENGHCVIAYGYNSVGIFINSWGLFGTMTWGAVAKYCANPDGELHVVLTEDSINKASLKAPTGFNRDQLLAYLKAV